MAGASLRKNCHVEAPKVVGLDPSHGAIAIAEMAASCTYLRLSPMVSAVNVPVKDPK